MVELSQEPRLTAEESYSVSLKAALNGSILAILVAIPLLIGITAISDLYGWDLWELPLGFAAGFGLSQLFKAILHRRMTRKLLTEKRNSLAHLSGIDG